MHVLLMMDSNRQIWFSAIFLVYIMPLISIYIFIILMKTAFTTEDDVAKKRKALEDKNAATKKAMAEWVKQHPAMQRRRRKWE